MILGFQDWEFIILIVLFVVFFITSIVVSVVILNKKRWPYTWVLTEDYPDGAQIKQRGKARLISIGNEGAEIYLLKGLKKWRVGYGRRIGKNQILWSLGDDGYWYNSSLGKMNPRLRELGIEPVDRDLRYGHSILSQWIDKTYDDRKWLDKYGVYVAFGMLFLCILAIGGIIWFIFDKQAEMASTNLEIAKSVKEIVDSTEKLVNANANIIGGGSGFIET